jgi:hypothetical protein
VLSSTDTAIYSNWNSYVMRLDWSSGRHDASYKAQVRAVSLGLTLEDVEERITELMIRAGRQPQPGELANQWPRAQAFINGNKDGTPVVRTIKPTPYDIDILKRQAALADDISDIRLFLLERSPEKTDISPQEYLSKVFPDEISIVFSEMRSGGYFVKPNEDNDWVEEAFVSGEVLGNSNGSWFLSNPVDGEIKPNASGIESARSEGNITAFRHVVCESDIAPKDLWLRAWATIKLPIVSIIDSGNPESADHVLVRVNAEDKTHWTEIVNTYFKRGLLAAMGADTKVMTSVRLTRLPNCHRLNKGGFQRLLYLNPNPQPKAIL